MKTEQSETNIDKNIVLVGMPGSGKTFIAKKLKEKLENFTLKETDSIIEEQEQDTIENIFKTKGEQYFRGIENNVIKEISEQTRQICSTGGGSLIDEKNIKNLQKNGILFYLEASIETLYERIKGETQRPLLKTENPKETLGQLLKLREEQYKKADFTINTNKNSIEDIVNEIIRKCEDYARRENIR